MYAAFSILRIMNPSKNIFLIGSMGAGKTTVGRHLARKLGINFFDTDREIETRCGVSIATIFEYEGESGFRDRESKIIKLLSENSPLVLATGGGSILREENRKILSARGTVFYLKVSLNEQYSRLSHDKTRPLLQTDNPREKLKQIMSERAPLYESVADLVVNSSGRNMRYVVNEIIKHYKDNA